MNAKRPVSSPTRRERWTVGLVTMGFIALSFVLHMILGGIFPPAGWRAAPAPSNTILEFERFDTPPPTPAPTPRPTPTPQRRVVTQPTPNAPSSHPPSTATPARHPVAIPSSVAPDAASDANMPPSQAQPASPEPSAPADYRYVIVSARFISEVHPEYPEDAARLGEEGTVIVLVTIGPQGPSDVRVWESSGYPELDRAALVAAKESTYSIPEMNGEPVTETYRVIYTFNLNS